MNDILCMTFCWIVRMEDYLSTGIELKSLIPKVNFFPFDQKGKGDDMILSLLISICLIINPNLDFNKSNQVYKTDFHMLAL